MSRNETIEVYPLEVLEQTLSLESEDCEGSSEPGQTPDGFAFASPSGFAVFSPSGFAVI